MSNIIFGEKMLILERKKGQGFMIREDIQITVLEQIGEYARIGISAPDSMSIVRSELLERNYGTRLTSRTPFMRNKTRR
jgi:carbon storage regulator CsrA